MLSPSAPAGLSLSSLTPRALPPLARRALALIGGVGLLGLLSGLWIYVNYNVRAWAEGHWPSVSLFDAVGTGVMDWGLWFLFLPLAVRTVRRFPLARERFVRSVAANAAAAALFSLGQLALFALLSVAVRALLYEQDPAWTRAEIIEASLASAFQVKFRTGVLLGLLVLGGLQARAARDRLRARLETAVRDDASTVPASLTDEAHSAERVIASAGGRVALLSFEEIDWVEAAGNYLRIHASGRVHLARGTLQGFLARAEDHGFVRVHRSTLVRPACIAGISAAGSGDLALELRDGTRLRASRRYRTALDGLLGARASRSGPAAAGHPAGDERS